MIEKRYSVDFVKELTPVYDREEQRYLNCFELDDLLHNLRKENRQFKEEIIGLQCVNQQLNHDSAIYEENKQLKFENKDLKSEISWIQDCAYWQKENAFDTLFGYYMKTCDEYRLLLKENEQLKEKNATMKGKIINAIVESHKVECSCNPCVCEEYVKKELMRD